DAAKDGDGGRAGDSKVANSRSTVGGSAGGETTGGGTAARRKAPGTSARTPETADKLRTATADQILDFIDNELGVPSDVRPRSSR
ncbi:hypothetical protein AB4212_38805, partial [Streptomyces sp. 2MCAF27]